MVRAGTETIDLGLLDVWSFPEKMDAYWHKTFPFDYPF
jgi:hypothetical protein